MMIADKKIYKLRLALTTKCLLDCRYCFVSKKDKVIKFAVASRAIEFLINSRGKEKLLMIYGGEPLIYFDLLKRITIFAQSLAKEKKKNLIISVGTNGLLLDEKRLNFFRKTKTKLAISMDGKKRFHDRARIFPGGDPSFLRVAEKLPIVMEMIAKEDLSVLFGVLPVHARHMFENMEFLIEQGFDNINIEPIQGKDFLWTKNRKKIFVENLAKVGSRVYKSILSEKYIFINSINRKLFYKKMAAENRCPFFENTEVYPDGEVAFSPFLMNLPGKERYLVGSFKTENFSERYANCKNNSESCDTCWSGYLAGGEGVFDNEIVSIRNRWSNFLAEKIIERSETDKRFKEYILQAKKRIFE